EYFPRRYDTLPMYEPMAYQVRVFHPLVLAILGMSLITYSSYYASSGLFQSKAPEQRFSNYGSRPTVNLTMDEWLKSGTLQTKVHSSQAENPGNHSESSFPASSSDISATNS
ncbi:hypothetical protein L9F63_024815, partial [Diploptera punctata]